jgi:DNA-binding HxlR family transcriptional regulator
MMHVLACVDDIGPTYFPRLQKALDTNANALAWNLRKLVGRGYVRRDIVVGRKQIVYAATEKGKKAIKRYFGP